MKTLQAGQRLEASLGLMYYGARWYDPALGRFIQADTIVLGGEQGLDRYAYANNNPVNFTDPIGHVNGQPPINNQICGPDNIYCGGLGDDIISTASCDSSELDTITYNGRTCYLVPVGSWHATTYISSLEADSSNMPSNYSRRGDIVRAKIRNLGGSSDQIDLSFRFLYGAEGLIMAGNGITNNGQWIYVDESSAQGTWQYTTCSYSNGSSGLCLDYFEGTVSFYWGYGRTGANQVPFKTAAVGSSFLGGTYYIPALAGMNDYPGGGFISGNDRGGAIQNGDIDIYVGIGLSSAYSAFLRYGLSTSNDTPIQVYRIVCSGNIPR